ncbi:FadR/GntR family transcriptional regulator [Dietzia sp. PP-33]|jgi:DNA-binding FadR family transcriptional regulator|uniref:FadR/GntR family transcriptional regulator n=1 Tax=Dietzia sp. PP-33 TaxID=2957500 RepID=UPI0029A325DE|nr:FadR/GntR family transcriptional regulator [Dietzia sp. PP-33]MDX2357647.1 FadR family transcriptional regulator [Dietzia sp. PP-33]
MPLVRRESLADQAADALLDRVRSGEWEVGGKLPGETTLAQQLGVGRSTVREAIRQLAGRKVLTSRQGAGVFVANLEIAEDWDAVLRRADIDAVIEARIAIEVEASALAAERRTQEDLTNLHRALAERARHRHDVYEHVDTDMAFHRGVLVAAHNPILLELFNHFAPRNREAMVDMLRHRGDYGDDADHAVHEDIYSAIESGDSARTAALTRTHLGSLKRPPR